MFSWLEENFAEEKFSVQRDAAFKEEKRDKRIIKDGSEAAMLLRSRKINSFFGTKFYNCEFLTKYKMKFDELIGDEVAKDFFQSEAFFNSKYLLYLSNALYIAPKN